MSPSPYGKSAFDRSRLEAAVSHQCLNSSTALSNYSLLDYQKLHDSYHIRAGIRSQDKQYMYGRFCGSHNSFLPKEAVASIANTGRKSISRRKSSPCRIEFGNPISVFTWNGDSDPCKPKCQSSDDIFDRYSRLQASEARQRAYSRTLSDCGLPATCPGAVFNDTSQVSIQLK